MLRLSFGDTAASPREDLKILNTLSLALVTRKSHGLGFARFLGIIELFAAGLNIITLDVTM